MISLIPDWKSLITKLWSIRLAVLSAVLSGAEITVQIYQPVSIDPGVFAGIAGLISIAAALARVVAQPKAHDGNDN